MYVLMYVYIEPETNMGSFNLNIKATVFNFGKASKLLTATTVQCGTVVYNELSIQYSRAQ